MESLTTGPELQNSQGHSRRHPLHSGWTRSKYSLKRTRDEFDDLGLGPVAVRIVANVSEARRSTLPIGRQPLDRSCGVGTR